MVYSLIIDINDPMINCEIIFLFYKSSPFSTHLFCELFEELSQVENFPKKCVCILGDLNCNLLKLEQKKNQTITLIYYLQQDFCQLYFSLYVLDPVRNSATLTDNICISFSSSSKFSSGIVLSDLSDHFSFYTKI